MPRRILIVRLGAIGDVVNALTVAAAIKDVDQTTHIAWLVHPLAEPLIQNNPVIDRVHCIPKKGWLRNIRNIRRSLREERYDLVIDLQRMQKSALLARQAGAERVLGYDRKRCKEGAWLWYNERIPTGPAHAHMVDQYAQFAAHLGCTGPPRWSLPPTPAVDRDWAQTLLNKWLGNPPIILHIGASKPENRLNPGVYREVAEGWLASQNTPLLLTGGPGDRADAEPTESSLSSHPNFHSLVGQTSLSQLAAILPMARGFVSCDTGPMHLAAAMGTRVLGLFGPADPRRTGPYGTDHLVLRKPGIQGPGPLPPASMDAVSSSDIIANMNHLTKP